MVDMTGFCSSDPLSSLVAHPLLGRDGQLGAGQVGVVDLLQPGQSEHVRILVTGDANSIYLLQPLSKLPVSLCTRGRMS